jgi:replicative DNA helicase
MTDHIDHTPPQDIAAEQAVLGAMLSSRDAIDTVAVLLKPSHYYRPAHALIHSAILALNTQGEAADPITVGAYLKEAGDLDRCKGRTYLHDLVNGVYSISSVADHADLVLERHDMREMLKATMAATAHLLSGEGEPRALMAAVQSSILATADDQPTDGLVLASSTMAGTVEKLKAIGSRSGKLLGTPTGFADLDALTNGLQGGQMVIVAGRPGSGKSTLAVDFLRATAIKHQLPAALFSLEMGHDEINMRILSAEARVGLHHMRSGTLTGEDWTRLGKVQPRIDEAPLWIDDSPNLDMVQIRAKARRLKEKQGLRLMVIDYMQLLNSGSGRRHESRQQEVTEISRNVKLLAKELDIPIVALCQLNRGPEQRTDKKPAVSDLRESGSLEQDCDIAILLHREDMYDKESARAGEADLIVAKHRNGVTTTVTVCAQLHYSRFADMAQV